MLLGKQDLSTNEKRQTSAAVNPSSSCEFGSMEKTYVKWMYTFSVIKDISTTSI